MPSFSPPTTNDRLLARGKTPGESRFWSHFGPQPTGQTVIREAGVWSTVSYPTSTRLDAADSIRDANGEVQPGYFLGGHVYTVSETIATELTDAGYDVL